MYAPWQSDSGCLAPGEFAASGVSAPDIIVSGSSDPADLAASSARLAVVLDCGAIAPDPGDVADCELDCADQQQDVAGLRVDPPPRSSLLSWAIGCQ